MNELIRDGETASPASTTIGIITHTSRPSASGRLSTVSTPRTTTSRCRSGCRQCTYPHPMPLAIEPTARAAMMTPDSGIAPA